jgi:photosystem II stability/assembly factor-like uncharacterized protein
MVLIWRLLKHGFSGYGIWMKEKMGNKDYGRKFDFLWLLIAAIWLAGRTDVVAQQRKAPVFEHVHALALDPSGRWLLLGAHTGLFRSADGGRSWKQVPVSAKYAQLDVMAVTPDPKNPRVIYVATHEAGVLKSADGGQTWKEMNAGIGGPDAHGLAIDPTSPSKLHAAVREKGQGIYRTNDGGVKWTRVDDGPGGEVKVMQSVNIPTDMGGIFLYAGTSRGCDVVRTVSEGGSMWAVCPPTRP